MAPIVPSRMIVWGTLVGILFIAGGLFLGYATFGTEFLTRFTSARPSPEQMVAGALAWTFALIAPAVFLIVGLARIADTVELVSIRRRPLKPAAAVIKSLPEDFVVGMRVRLPDGRVVPELVVGPFGVAVIEELPPASASRHVGGNWEMRAASGKWVPVENPLDRASRDAERVRRWLAEDERDHIVKTYAAVVASDATVPRSPTCAVVAPGELPGWLAALPVQRSLNGDRRDRIVDLIRDAVA
jgi:hypothetical protein